MVISEGLARASATGPGFAVHSDMTATYIDSFASVELKDRWLPKLISGECIAALDLTEPDAGCDLKEIRTTAVRDGDDYVINGQNVYISNVQLCDIVVLDCKTVDECLQFFGGYCYMLEYLIYKAYSEKESEMKASKKLFSPAPLLALSIRRPCPSTCR